MKKTVAIIFGGESSEYDVSCVSAANVAENINPDLFETVLVGITKDGEEFVVPSGMDEMGPVLTKLREALTGMQMGTVEAPEGWIRKIL